MTSTSRKHCMKGSLPAFLLSLSSNLCDQQWQSLLVFNGTETNTQHETTATPIDMMSNTHSSLSSVKTSLFSTSSWDTVCSHVFVVGSEHLTWTVSTIPVIFQILSQTSFWSSFWDSLWRDKLYFLWHFHRHRHSKTSLRSNVLQSLQKHSNQTTNFVVKVSLR